MSTSSCLLTYTNWYSLSVCTACEWCLQWNKMFLCNDTSHGRMGIHSNVTHWRIFVHPRLYKPIQSREDGCICKCNMKLCSINPFQSSFRVVKFMYFNKVLIIWPNTNYRSSTTVFYYVLQHIWAVHISQHQVAIAFKKGEREKALFTVLWIITLFQKWNNKVETNTQPCYRIP